MRLVTATTLNLVCILALGCGAQIRKDTQRPELPQPKRDLELPDVGRLAQFDNGITLFVLPDEYTRLIQFDVRQQVGSRDDPQGQAGMAHFVEHLMFQMPADGPDTPKLMSDIQQHALSFNAYTSMDETHYMHTGTGDELETYMKYTALRLSYDCDAVDENSFLREREVVRNEHRWRGENVDVIVRDKVLELAFPEGHPYRHKTFGADADVASITPDDACKFVRRYYNASQADVVITGDVDPSEALELANKYLAPLPKVEPKPRKPVPPPKLSTGNATIKAPVEKPTALILYQMPPRFTNDNIAASAAIETVFLAVSFFTSKRLSVVKDFSFTGLGGKEAQLIGVSVETKEAEQLDRAVDEVLDAINRGLGADVSSEEYKGTYDSARQRARLNTLSSVATVFSRSGAYADYLEEGDRPGFYGAELAALDNLTSVQIQAVGRKVFAREKALVVKVVPDGTKDKPTAERASFDYQPKDDENLSAADDIDPAEAQRPLPLNDIAPPEGQSVEYTLDNGMRVVLVQSSNLQVMDVQVIVGAGLADARGQRAIAEMASRAYGVRDDREGRNLAKFFDAAGGIFFSNVGPLSTSFRSRGLSIYLDFIIAGVSDRVVQGEYRTGALEMWKQSQREALKKKSNQQAAARDNAFYKALYGPGHPLIRERVTDPKKLRALTLKDLEKFRNDHYRAANSAIIVTGGFDMELATQYVEAFFNKPQLRDRKLTWNEPKVTAARPKPLAPAPGNVRFMTEMDKERAQTQLTIAYPLAEVYGDDHAALLVMATMLNNGVGDVRQKLGASYGVYARVDTGRPRLEIGGALDSARGGDGYLAIRQAIDDLRASKDFDRQFAFARRTVLQNMINAQGDPQLLAGQLAQAVQAGRSYEYFRDLARKVATLEPAAVKAQVKRVILDDRSVTLIQGPQLGIDNITTAGKITGATKLPDAIHDEDE